MLSLKKMRKLGDRMSTEWGLGNVKIHSSLLLTMGLISGLFLILGITNQAGLEFRSVAITLPFVWCVSVAVRVAAQQLSLGPYANDIESIIGPTGNLSTDYEFVPKNRQFSYAVSGQLATIGLIAVGMSVSAAMSPFGGELFAWHSVLDFRGGWGNEAWSTQITWVNLFLAGVHCLPTVPFDARAAAFALFSGKSDGPQEPRTLHRLSSTDSHLATFCVGSGVTMALVGWTLGQEIIACYGAIAAAVYLYVASKWEAARAAELEQQYAPLATRIVRNDRAAAVSMRTHQPRAALVEEPEMDETEVGEHQHKDELQDTDVDVDEILRKLHREGRDSLSERENEKLLSASRLLKKNRDEK